MGMTIDEAIRRINEHNYINQRREPRAIYISEAFKIAIDTMRKYQKITKILNSASYTENGTVYSYTYDEDTRVKHIREVIKDGKID